MMATASRVIGPVAQWHGTPEQERWLTTIVSWRCHVGHDMSARQESTRSSSGKSAWWLNSNRPGCWHQPPCSLHVELWTDQHWLDWLAFLASPEGKRQLAIQEWGDEDDRI